MAGIIAALAYLFMEAMDWRYFLGMTPAFMLSAIVAYASEADAAIIGVMAFVSLCAGAILFAMKRDVDGGRDLAKPRIRG